MLFSNLFNVFPIQRKVDKCLRICLNYLWRVMEVNGQNVKGTSTIFFSFTLPSNLYVPELFVIIYMLTSCLICFIFRKINEKKNDNKITTRIPPKAMSCLGRTI